MQTSQQIMAAIQATGIPPTPAQWQEYTNAVQAENVTQQLPSILHASGDMNVKRLIKDDVSVVVMVVRICSASGNKEIAPLVLQALRNPTSVFAHSAMRSSQATMLAGLADPNGNSSLTLQYVLSDPNKEVPNDAATLGQRAALEARAAAINDIVCHTVQRIMVQEVDTLRKTYNQQGTLGFPVLHGYLAIHASQFLLPWEAQKIAREERINKRPRLPGM